MANSLIVKAHLKQDTVRDLQMRILEALHLESETPLVMVLRYEQYKSSTSIRSEIYNFTFRMSKSLEEGPKLESCNDSSLTIGTIYVEEGYVTTDKSDKTAWHREFNKSLDNITLLLNNPSDISEDVKFTIRVQVKKSNTFSELREKVAEQLGNVKSDNLILRKNGHKGELKGSTSKLSELGLIDGDLIRVELGTPNEEDSYTV